MYTDLGSGARTFDRSRWLPVSCLDVKRHAVDNYGRSGDEDSMYGVNSIGDNCGGYRFYFHILFPFLLNEASAVFFPSFPEVGRVIVAMFVPQLGEPTE